MQNIDELKFGNCSQDAMHWIGRQSYLDKHFTQLTTFTFPANSSSDTNGELMAIINALNVAGQNKEMLHRYIEIDRKGYRFYKEIIDAAPQIEEKEEFYKIVDDIIIDSSPIIYKLKQYFNRPRPYQLAFYSNIMLSPMKSMSQDSPSFPCASVFYARIITEVIGNRCPQLYGNMKQLFGDVYNSRLGLGLNYPSDIDVGMHAGDLVLQDKEFIVKFKL
jgi:hypothetical protein